MGSAQWIISGYLLALALMLPLTGWLVDRIGAKKLYLLCFSTFTAASILCGAARSVNELISTRVLQGAAGGLLAPMTQLMIARVAGNHMARVMGYTAIPILIAPILGPVVAGAVLNLAPWPWLFYLNLPTGIIAIGLAAILLPKDEKSLQKRPFDFLGFLTISPSLVCLLYGLNQSTHRDGDFIFLFGFLLLGVFIWHALRKGNSALIDLSLFKNRVFSAAAITQFLSNGVLYGGHFLVPLYLIIGCELSASQAGWLISALGVGMMCSFPLMGTLTERFGFRAVSRGGAFLSLLGTLPFFWMIQHDFLPSLTILSLFFRGLGQGAIGIPSVAAAYSSVLPKDLSIATTAMNIAQRLGGPFSTTVIGIVLSLSSASHSSQKIQQFILFFLILTGLQVLVLTAANQLPRQVQIR